MRLENNKPVLFSPNAIYLCAMICAVFVHTFISTYAPSYLIKTKRKSASIILEELNFQFAKKAE